MTTERETHLDSTNEPAPLRANDSDDKHRGDAELSVLSEFGTAERQRRYVALYDPRRQPQVTDRDRASAFLVATP